MCFSSWAVANDGNWDAAPAGENFINVPLPWHKEFQQYEPPGLILPL